MNRKKITTKVSNNPTPANMKNQVKKKNRKTSPAATNFVTCADANPTVTSMNERKVRMIIQNNELEVRQDAVTTAHIPLDRAGKRQSSWAKLLTHGPVVGGLGIPGGFPVMKAHIPILQLQVLNPA